MIVGNSTAQERILGVHASLGSDGAGVWEFEGTAGDVISVTVGSEDLDPVVYLLSIAGDELARDDDSGPGTDARLLAVLPETGRYVVGVTAFDGESGSYEVTVHEMPPVEITVGDSARGDLGSGAVAAGVWEFTGDAGAVVSVAVGSDAFDPVVELLSPAGEQLARDDDSGPGTDARLLAVLPETGPYVVRVSAIDNEPGPYEVTVHEMRPAPVMVDGSDTGDLGSGSVAAGVWEFTGDAGVVVSVAVGSDAFDPVVELLSPAGEQLARDDDSGPGTDARLLAILPETGPYVVGVTAFDGEPGPYEVTVHEMGPVEITVGDSDTGDLGSGSVAVGVWEFTGDAGAVVSVAVGSDAFDPVVELLSPAGEQLARDDSGRLLAVLPETGRYVVGVTANDDGTGPYEMAVRVVEVREKHEMNTTSEGVLR